MLVVLAAAAVVIVRDFLCFIANPRPLWRGMVHDRNSHYEFALKLALALRGLQPIRFVSIALGQSKVWPPVHGFLTALLIAPLGPDYRVAVIPSLLGWGMTAAFAFLVAKRISPAGARAAATISAALVLASPAYRDYGTDIMLESLGAGLTMMVLYFYAVARQEESVRSWRNLSIALTILFFEKYNFWLLAVLALGAAEILRWCTATPAPIRKAARAFSGKVNRDAVIRELGHPLNLLAAAMLLLMGAIWVRGPRPVQVGPWNISVYPPRDVLTAAYAALALRVMLAAPRGWWRRFRASSRARSQLMLWHVLPVAVSFLLPGRLWMFLWYVGPLNHASTVPVFGLRWALNYYTHAAVYEYHPASWIAWMVGAAFLAAVVSCRNWLPGGTAVVALAIIGGAAVLVHPNQQNRYLFSWFAAVWVAAATAVVATIYSCRLPVPFRIRDPIAGTVAGVAFVTLMIYAWKPPAIRPGLSDLDLSDAYLPTLKPFRQVTFLSNMPIGSFVTWTYLERYRRAGAAVWPLKGSDFSPTMGAQSFTELAVEGTRGEAVIFVDVPAGSPDYMPLSDYSGWKKLCDAVRSDPRLHVSRVWEIASHDVKITMWTRARTGPR